MSAETPAVEGLPPGCGLWFGWIIASSLGTGIGWALGWRASYALPGLFSPLAIGLVVGLLLGAVQMVVLRGLVSNPVRWAGATALGWGLGFPAGSTLAQLFGLTEIWFGALTGAVVGLFLALFQWLVLHGRVSRAWLWAPTSLFAWATSMIYYRPGITAIGFLYGLLAGIVTGVTLVWLVYRPVDDPGTAQPPSSLD